MAIKQKASILETLKMFRRSLIYQTKVYFDNSTLHGVRYIAESGRPLGEKFMWFCFTATGTVTALVIIMSLWEKFQTNPTITGLDTDFHNQQVMFPTTVVCLDESYDEAKLLGLADTLTNYNEEDLQSTVQFLKLLTKLSYHSIDDVNELAKNLSGVVVDSIQQKSLRSLVFQVHAAVENVLQLCKYRGEEATCASNFDQIYTEHGFCYAFNSRFKSVELKEEDTAVGHDLYETDKKWALYLLPNASGNVFIFAHEEYFGWDFKPQLYWEVGQTAEILITKKNTYTTSDAQQLSIGQRKCIFPEEVKLDYFPKEYTFSSCMIECRMKKAYKYCRCLPPFSKPLGEKIPFCNIKELACLAKHRQNITNIKDCLKCELSCSKTVFSVEKLNRGFEKSTEEGITVEFLTWPIIRYKREVLFGWVDLLVSFGGIAGLFLGFSLLSGVEIIYYFTMRACCMVYRNRDELYAIEEEILRTPVPLIDMALKPKLITEKRQRSASVPDIFDPPKKIEPKNVQQKLHSFGDIEKRRFRRGRQRQVFVRPIFKQVKAAPSYNMFSKPGSHSTEFVYLP